MSRAAFRLIGIGTTLARYRLDDLLDLLPGLRALRWLRGFVPAPRGDLGKLRRHCRAMIFADAEKEDHRGQQGKQKS